MTHVEALISHTFRLDPSLKLQSGRESDLLGLFLIATGKLCRRRGVSEPIMASPTLSDSKHVHLEGLQREVDFLQNENALLEGFLQRVSIGQPLASP